MIETIFRWAQSDELNLICIGFVIRGPLDHLGSFILPPNMVTLDLVANRRSSLFQYWPKTSFINPLFTLHFQPQICQFHHKHFDPLRTLYFDPFRKFNRQHRYWWRMIQTIYVDDNFKILMINERWLRLIFQIEKITNMSKKVTNILIPSAS